MDTLNYSTQAVAELRSSRAFFARLGAPLPQTIRISEWIADKLDAAQKFVLPDNGELLGDVRDTDYSSFMGLSAPPFPLTAVEFYVAEHKLPTHEFAPIATRRRLALILDLQNEPLRAEFIATFGSMLLADVKMLDNCFCIWSIDDQSGVKERPSGMPCWTVAACGVVLHCVEREGEYEAIRLNGERKHVVAGTKDARGCYSIAGVALAGEMGAVFVDKHNGESHRVMGVALSEISLELMASVGLFAALSCRNVKLRTIAVGEGVNQKRVKSGKRPLYDYHVLELGIADGATAGADGGSGQTGATLRQHLRRGHIRRLQDKRIWVNSTIVNPGFAAKVEKSYRVKS